MEQEQPLDEEAFDMAATRPPLTFGLPHTLCACLLFVGIFGLFLVGDPDDFKNEIIYDSIWVGFLGMIWSGAKIVLRADYHGWDIFLSWVRLDARFLDTKEWGGAHLSSFPLNSMYCCAWYFKC